MNTFCRYPVANSGRLGNYATALEQAINERNPSFILCVTATARSDLYSLIKRQLSVDRAGIILLYILFKEIHGV